MKNDFQGSSRAGYRAKRKKTNFVLNGLIVIVLLLIVFVGYSIFISGNDKTAAKKDVQTTAAKTVTEKKSVNKTTKNDKTSEPLGYFSRINYSTPNAFLPYEKIHVKVKFAVVDSAYRRLTRNYITVSLNPVTAPIHNQHSFASSFSIGN